MESRDKPKVLSHFSYFKSEALREREQSTDNTENSENLNIEGENFDRGNPCLESWPTIDDRNQR